MRLNLSGSCGKLERALRYLNELGDGLAIYSRMNSGKLSLADEEVHPHPDGVRHVLRMGKLAAPSPGLGLIVGDYVQNLRAALDHLAFEMVRRGSKWSRAVERVVQFPIYSIGNSRKPRNKGPLTFANQVGKKVPGIPTDQRALIDRYQPYHRGKWHLATLAELSNQDKHRVITPVALFATNLQRRHLGVTKGTILDWNILLPEGRPVNQRTPLFEVIGSAPDAQVEMYTDLTTHVAFRERPGRYHRPRALEEIGEVVAEIVGESARRWGKSWDAECGLGWAARGRKALGLS
jgi:hypothetical protein